jgi:hypothetical protein
VNELRVSIRNAMLHEMRKRIKCFFSPVGERLVVSLCVDSWRNRNGGLASRRGIISLIASSARMCGSAAAGADAHTATVHLAFGTQTELFQMSRLEDSGA